MNLESLLTKTSFKQYQEWLKTAKIPPATSKRKLYSLKKFASFWSQHYLKETPNQSYQNVSEKIKIPANLSLHPINPVQLFYRRFSGTRISSYLNLAILVLFSAALAVFGYNQIFKQAQLSQAYPQAPNPQSPNRYLSFQARLTDSSDNPITPPTDMRFIIYNSPQDFGK